MCWKSFKTLLSLALCAALLLVSAPFAAAADEGEEDAAEEKQYSVLREEEIAALIEDYLTENRIPRDKIGIGFLYTATGEEWYYNGDLALYSASLYKLPLLMLVSNMVARGELEQDGLIEGHELTKMEEAILTVSNNQYAHLLMNHFWPRNSDCRLLWPELAGMQMEDMPPRFEKTSAFTPRFVTRLLYNLYSHPDDYPMMLDFLKQAAPDQFFRYQLEGRYEVAQKMGYYEQYHHTAGIIYTENPIIVTYMTVDIPAHGRFSGDLALRLADYAQTLDERLQEEKQAERERLEAEQRQREEEARKAEEERLRREAEERQAREAAEAEAERLRLETEAREQRELTLATAVGGALAAALTVGAIVLMKKRRAPKEERKQA